MKCSDGFGSRPQRNEVLTSLAQLYQIRFSLSWPRKDPISSDWGMPWQIVTPQRRHPRTPTAAICSTGRIVLFLSGGNGPLTVSRSNLPTVNFLRSFDFSPARAVREFIGFRFSMFHPFGGCVFVYRFLYVLIGNILCPSSETYRLDHESNKETETESRKNVHEKNYIHLSTLRWKMQLVPSCRNSR